MYHDANILVFYVSLALFPTIYNYMELLRLNLLFKSDLYKGKTKLYNDNDFHLFTMLYHGEKWK